METLVLHLTNRTWILLVASVLTLGLAFAACGGDDDDNSGGGATVAATDDAGGDNNEETAVASDAAQATDDSGGDGSSGPGDPCELVTATEVSQVMARVAGSIPVSRSKHNFLPIGPHFPRKLRASFCLWEP